MKASRVCGLVVVVGVGSRLVGLLGRGDLGPKLRDLGFEAGPLGFAGPPLLLGVFPGLGGLGESSGDLLELLEGGGGHLRGPRQGLRRECQAWIGLLSPRIGAGQPVGEVEEFPEGGDGCGGSDGPGLVDRRVANILDDPGFRHQRLAD